MASRKPAAITISAELVSKILRTVSMAEAFHFFTDIGQDTGKSATSLADFRAQLKVVPLKSIEFHSKRGDYERWFRETLGDEYLAREIGKIEKSVHREHALEGLRTAIQTTVENRLHYLKQRNSERASWMKRIITLARRMQFRDIWFSVQRYRDKLWRFWWERHTGFCTICIPTTLNNGTFTVLVKGPEVPYTLLPESNSTHSYLYFTHHHSTQEVIIIPEYSLCIVLSIFMIETLLTVIPYRARACPFSLQ